MTGTSRIDLPRPGLEETGDAISRGERTAGDNCEDSLERIASYDSQLNAFITVAAGSARSAAADIDARPALDRGSLPLAGVCLGIKDNLVGSLGEVPTTAGSRILSTWIPPAGYEATCVERLHRAGAVIIGKTNCDEFGMGSSGEYSAFGATRNPRDLGRVPGGSSSGSAAAVAAGLVDAALGTDTGGSIRQPAALTGTVGLKPTWGRVSRWGLVAYASSFDSIGPITRTVRGAALLLGVIAGQDTRDATSSSQPVPDYLADIEADVEGFVVARLSAGNGTAIQPAISAGVQQAADLLAGAGARVEHRPDPVPHEAIAAYYLIATSEAASNLARYDGLRYGSAVRLESSLTERVAATRGTGFGPEVRRRIVLGTFALSRGYAEQYYRRAVRLRARVGAAWSELFESADLVLMPTTPTTAWPLGEKLSDPVAMYLSDRFTIPVNLAGLPAISVPIGEDENGLPVGVQLVAPPFAEKRLLRAARAIERGCA